MCEKTRQNVNILTKRSHKQPNRQTCCNQQNRHNHPKHPRESRVSHDTKKSSHNSSVVASSADYNSDYNDFADETRVEVRQGKRKQNGGCHDTFGIGN